MTFQTALLALRFNFRGIAHDSQGYPYRLCFNYFDFSLILKGVQYRAGFYNFCVQQFMQFSLFWPYSLFFSFSIYFLTSHPDWRILLNTKRKQNSSNEAEKDSIACTAVHRNDKILQEEGGNVSSCGNENYQIPIYTASPLARKVVAQF